LLTILFYFDHNGKSVFPIAIFDYYFSEVSSLIAQGTEFPLRKPAGFYWDLFLLGLTTGGAGLLGIPAPNELTPQAPFHTQALCVTNVIPDLDEEWVNKSHVVTKVDHVVEQRVSNLAQGLLTLGTMTGPLLVVLHLIPQGVLVGLFFVMVVQAIEGNGITDKILFLARDKTLTPGTEPLKRIQRRLAIWAFVAIQLVGFGATFAITQTIAAVGFPIIILLLIPVRTHLLPKWFTEEELSLLDAPTASPFTMISVGGNFGQSMGELDPISTGEQTAVPSGSASVNERLFVLREENDSEEVRAERGQGPGVGMKRRASRRSESRTEALGESIEMTQKPSVRRRSVNWQQR
jgi:boron transporter